MYKKLFLAHKINHWYIIKNDPSAGSPTETLLRLLLPLENLICKFSESTLILQEDNNSSNPLTNSSNR